MSDDPRGKRYTAQQRAQAIAAYQAGMTMTQAAAQVGATKGIVWHWLRSAGVPRRRKSRYGSIEPPITATQREMGTLALKAGVPTAQIATDIGVSVQTVHRWATAAGIPLPPPGTYPRTVRHRATSSYQYGATMREIAERYDVDEELVRKWLHEDRVPIRSVGPRPLPVTDAEILDLAAEGLNWQQIADKVGMSRSGVRGRYRKAVGVGRWR